MGPDEQVDLRVGQACQADFAGALRAQETGAVAAQGQQVLGGQAEVVLCVGVRHAIADAFVVGRCDVGDAVGGAIDLHHAGAGLRGIGTADEHGSGDDG